MALSVPVLEADPPFRTATVAVIASLAAIAMLVVTLPGLGDGSLWLDETLTVVDASRNWADVWAWRSDRWSPHPPLYYAAVKLAMSTCGTSEACVRAPSALFAAGVAAALVALANRLFGRTAAMTTAMLWPVLPYAVKYAEQARHYPLLALLGVVAVGLTARGLDLDDRGPARRSTFVALGVVTAALLWTHAFAVPLLAALGLWWLGWWWAGPRSVRGSSQQWAITVAVTTLLIAPLVVPWRDHILGDPQGHFASQAGPVENADKLMVRLLELVSDQWWVAALVMLGWLAAPRGRRMLQLSLVALAIAPLGAVVVRNPNHFVPLRYFMPSVAILALVVPSTVAHLGRRAHAFAVARKARGALAVVIGIAVAAAVAAPIAWALAPKLRRELDRTGYEQWDVVAAYLHSHRSAGELVVVVPDEIRHALAVYDADAGLVSGGAEAVAAELVARPSAVYVVTSHLDRPDRRSQRLEVLRQLHLAHYVRDHHSNAPFDDHIQVMVWRPRDG